MSSRHSLSQSHGQTTLLTQNMLRKGDEYKEGIRDNHSNACDLAGRLVAGGEIQNFVGDVNEYKDRLKRLAENNVQQERKLNTFLHALEQLGNQENVDDYQTEVDTLMNRSLQQMERCAVDIQQQEMYMEICTKLGDVTPAARNGGEEEDLEIVETGQSLSKMSLKCPLTLSYFVNPVKHVRCGHIFSREAILAQIKRDKKCPVPGCTTGNMQPHEFKPDRDTERAVKRAKRQSEIHQQALSQQAIDADDDEEEEFD